MPISIEPQLAPAATLQIDEQVVPDAKPRLSHVTIVTVENGYILTAIRQVEGGFRGPQAVEQHVFTNWGALSAFLSYEGFIKSL